MPAPFRSRYAGSPLAAGASRWTVACGRMRAAFGRLLNVLRLPGAVRDLKVIDSVTGQQLEIRVEPLFTRISVDGRDYYFGRISGRFDGTGYAGS